ncbi:hypothetical protein NFJ02_28g65810 [Pycnococcus provasolii]
MAGLPSVTSVVRGSHELLRSCIGFENAVLKIKYEVHKPVLAENTHVQGRLVITLGGKGGILASRGHAREFASRGYLVLTHDRRGNQGSSWGIRDSQRYRDDSSGSFLAEPLTHALDTCALVDSLEEFQVEGDKPPHWLGESSGARMSIYAAALRPECVRSLVCMNLTAGPKAAEVIAHAYHGENADDVRAGGLDALRDGNQDSAARMDDPELVEELESVGAEKFIAWSDAEATFVRTHAVDGYPLVAIRSGTLARIRAPSLGIHTFGGFDGMHTAEAIRNFASGVSGSECEFYDPRTVNEDDVMDRIIRLFEST